MPALRAFFKDHILFIVILISSALLRFIPLFNYQFTFDEWSGLYRTNFSSFSELIEKGVKIDAHPAFVQVLIYYLSHWLGYEGYIIKLPFLLFSLGAIIYAYAFCIRNFSKQAALIATAIFCYSLIFVFYAPIARMYIAGVFFSIALLFHFCEIFFLKNEKTIHYVFLALFALLSAYNQHINALFALTVCASGFLFLNPKNIKPYVLTCLLTILIYLPHIGVTLYQLGIAGIGLEQGGWLVAPQPDDLFKFLKVLFGTGRSYIVFLMLVLFAFILKRSFLIPKLTWFLLGIFLLNFLIVYLYSVLRAPVFQHSVMLFSGTAAVIGISSLITFKYKYVFYAALTTIICVLLFKTYFKKDYLHQSVKTIFDYQFERTSELKQKHGDKLVTAVFFDADTFMKHIRFKKLHRRYDCIITGDKEISNTQEYSKFIHEINSQYLVLASAFTNHQAIAKEVFPYLIESAQTQGLNYKVYSRKAADSSSTVNDDNLLMISTPQNPGKAYYASITLPFKIDSLNEFPYSVRVKLSDITNKGGQVVVLKTRIKANTMPLKDIVGCISLNDLNTDSMYAYSSASIQDHYLNKDSSVTIYVNLFCGNGYNNYRNKTKLKAYLWNRGKVKFTVMSFEITTVDFWPQKWNFWE